MDEAIQATQAVIDKTRKVKQGLLQQLLTRGIGHTRFKQTETGQIPETWETVLLKSVCKRITDGSHQSVKKTDQGAVPFLFVSCVRDGTILWDKTARITIDTYDEIAKGREPLPGVILYTVVGSYGHAVLVETKGRFGFERNIAYVVPDSIKLDPRYLVQLLNSPLGREQADRVAMGNAQKLVTLRSLSLFSIPLPPLQEQRKIAAFCRDVDASLSTQSARLRQLVYLKRGLMQDLLTGHVRAHKPQQAEV